MPEYGVGGEDPPPPPLTAAERLGRAEESRLAEEVRLVNLGIDFLLDTFSSRVEPADELSGPSAPGGLGRNTGVGAIIGKTFGGPMKFFTATPLSSGAEFTREDFARRALEAQAADAALAAAIAAQSLRRAGLKSALVAAAAATRSAAAVIPPMWLADP